MRKILINAKVTDGVITGDFPMITTNRNGEARKEIDNGAFGTLFELLIANISNPKDKRQKLKSQGLADIKCKYNYDTKTASSPIKYGNKNYIYGSSRLIYAPFVNYEIVKMNDKIVTLKVDIRKQNVFCVSKKDFLEIIEILNLRKNNKSRDTVNINTVWNYTTGKAHSQKKLKQFIELLSKHNIENDELYGKIKAY